MIISKNKASIFSLLVAFMLLMPCFSVSASSSVLQDNISWTADGTVLTFEGSGEMVLTYEYLSEIPWYHLRNTVDTVVIGEGITTIGEGAFTAFRSLKNISFPETLTTVGESAFVSCEALEHVALPKRTTRVETGAFVGCLALKSFTVPGSVYYISNDAFYNCEEVKIVGIPGSYAETFAKSRNIPFDGSLPTPSEISVSVNNQYVIFDQPPVIVNDRTLVPLRKIFETLGATVDWNAETRTVTSVRGDTTVILTIDSNIIYKNGKAIEIDVPAQIIGDRTLAPARAVSESFGASVDWNPITRTVIIDD